MIDGYWRIVGGVGVIWDCTTTKENMAGEHSPLLRPQAVSGDHPFGVLASPEQVMSKVGLDLINAVGDKSDYTSFDLTLRLPAPRLLIHRSSIAS